MKYLSIIFFLSFIQIASAQYTPGIQRNYFEGSFNKLSDFTTLKPLKVDTVTIRFIPHATEDPASGAFRASVTKY